MKRPNDKERQTTPKQQWQSIHETLDKSRNSMYLVGSPEIILLWGVIVALGYLSMHGVESLTPAFAADKPWYPGPLWFGLGVLGMLGSSTIGYRASRQKSDGLLAKSVGLRVFGFWVATVAAAFIIPVVSGVWTPDSDPIVIRGISIGIIALGYVLFGIMYHPAIALAGLGIAASYYLPPHLAGDGAPLLSAGIVLVVLAFAWAWIRKSRTA